MSQTYFIFPSAFVSVARCRRIPLVLLSLSLFRVCLSCLSVFGSCLRVVWVSSFCVVLSISSSFCLSLLCSLFCHQCCWLCSHTYDHEKYVKMRSNITKASPSEEPALGSDFWSIRLHCFQMVLKNRSLNHGGNPGVPKMPAHPADQAIGRTARRQAGADQKSRTEENTVETATVCDSESVWSSGTFLDGASDVSTCCGDTEPGYVCCVDI